MEPQHNLSQKEAEVMLGRIFAVATIIASSQKRRRKHKKLAEKHEEENALYRKAANEPEET